MIGLLRKLLRKSPDGLGRNYAGGPSEAVGSTLLEELPALILDTEATGLDVSRDRIVSIGAVTMRGPELLDEAALDRLVNPERPIPKRAIEIHGISDAMVTDAPRFVEICDELAAVAEGRIWIGHNIGFDIALVEREMALAGRPWRRPDALCMAQLFQALYPAAPAFDLDSIAAFYDVDCVGRHSALADARISADVYRCIIAELVESGVRRFSEAAAVATRARQMIRRQRAAGW
jgi:DNA polymerase-3 subunit epsilon